MQNTYQEKILDLENTNNSINKKLELGTYDICYACRMPISKNDLKSKEYIKGISCPKCHKKKSEKQLNKYKTRKSQLLKENKNDRC